MTVMLIDELPATNEDGDWIDGTEDDPCCNYTCPPEPCGICDPDSPDEIQLDVDATLATGNAGATINGCDDADCQDLSGTYVLTRAACDSGTSWNVSYLTDGVETVLAEFDWADTCCWKLAIDDNPGTLPCVTNTFADVMYYGWEVRVALASDGDYYLYIKLTFSDFVPSASGSGTSYEWLKNLGSTAPDCTTISEAITDAEYISKGTFMGTPIEDLIDSCYYDTITPIDVLAL